ncbi:hypothetical protein OCS_06432 [Ophiocordyceps sinensis CO18]|uniref:Uncharacterized protein n=1 Tax=Ophiocordyceps sinensis (strain Co18 / CGMCC 3.14243) TaxID=911162 RepID=T5A628_OPHSC|nr:hypothetical protein OCS_06432 [Ophiocordyceps sinensis CO18]
MEQALGQPDFGSISGSFDTLSRQFALCGNLPAVDGGARLADRMDRMEGLLQQMSRTLQRVDEGLVGLTRRMDISDENAVVRVENSAAKNHDAPLLPLLSKENGRPIAGCPATVGNALSLAAQDATALLRQFGLSQQGGVGEKRKRILFAMGVRSLDL